MVQLHSAHLGLEILHAVLLRPVDLWLEHADLRPMVKRRNRALLHCGLLDYKLRLFPNSEELAGYA